MPYTYILQCSDSSFYTGSTWNLEKEYGITKMGKGLNIQKSDYQSNSFIMKNIHGLVKHIKGRNRFRGGAGKRRKH